MDAIVILVFVIQWVLCCSEVTAYSPCPSQCICTTKEAKCSHLTNSISGPFPEGVVNVTITDSNLTKLESQIFANSTEYITIADTHIKDILSETFANFRFIKSIQLIGVFIGNIKTRSFYNINSPAQIHFRDSTIDRFECGAISNMSQLQRISIEQSIVDYIDSGAFFNIRVGEFIIRDTDIVSMNTSSFSSIYQVQNFSFFMVNINSVKAGAFSNVENIQNVHIKGCKFRDLHCNALMVLREATPGNHATFVMSNSELNCSCLIVPMVKYILNHTNAVSDSVLCVEGRKSQPLKRFQVPASCSRTDDSCTSVEPLKSTSSSNTIHTVETTSTTPSENVAAACPYASRITLMLCVGILYSFHV